MHLVKALCSMSVRAGLAACGSLLMLSALGGYAYARGVDAPEIDPGSLSSAITLFVGGVMLLTSRRKSNSPRD